MGYFFYCFFALLLLFCSIIVFSQNAIRAAFSLAATFIIIPCLLILIGIEFYSFLLIILYVGAVIVLFLFLIIFEEAKPVKNNNALSMLILSITSCSIFMYKFFTILQIPPSIKKINNITIKEIGHTMFDNYSLIFQIIGILLMTSMSGAVMLINEKKQVKKHKTEQHKLMLIDKEIGSGIEENI